MIAIMVTPLPIRILTERIILPFSSIDKHNNVIVYILNNKIKYTQKPKLCILIAGNAK